MEIEFKTGKLQKYFNTDKDLQREFGSIRSQKIKLRMKVLQTSSNLEEVPFQKPDRRHQLSGNRKGQFAVDLDQPYRLIFEPKEPIPYLPDNSIDLKKVASIIIIGVEDYHG